MKIQVGLRGLDLIREPLLNKGSAFTDDERRAFGLEGLLPAGTLTMAMQARRIMDSLARTTDPLEKYVALASLQDRNEHLYFHLLTTRLEELMPIVYTPTVGLATRRFSHVFQRGRGVWITPGHRGRIAQVLRDACGRRPIRLIVATDNESILGIGDQGAGGMAISIGKLALYSSIAGIHPAHVLPVSLDVGTDNETLLADPMYIGWQQTRLRGPEYDGLVDEFVDAVASLWPAALVQWEDFRKDNALRVLDRHRDRLPSFNDDIQGTGAVALAGLYTAMRVTGRSLADERIVISGGGAAGLGVARQLRAALEAQARGAQPPGAGVAPRIAVLDSRGLIADDGRLRDAYKRELACTPEELQAVGLEPGADLMTVIRALRPTLLIGTSGQPGTFTEPMVRLLADTVDQPVILPISNPTECAEATPEDVYRWSGGRALVATGSPFDDVTFDGQRRRIGQGNNAFIFSAVGLAVLAGGIRRVDEMLFTAAARSLADQVRDDELASGMLFPPVSRARSICRVMARDTLTTAVCAGLCEALTDPEIDARLDDHIWEPVYRPYTYGAAQSSGYSR